MSIPYTPRPKNRISSELKTTNALVELTKQLKQLVVDIAALNKKKEKTLASYRAEKDKRLKDLFFRDLQTLSKAQASMLANQFEMWQALASIARQGCLVLLCATLFCFFLIFVLLCNCLVVA